MAFGKADRSSTTSDASSPLSLQGAFLADFPVDDDGKFKKTKGSLTSSNKEELATLLVNVFKLVEMANDSRHFRQLQKHTGELNSIVKRALLYVKEQKENDSEPKLLRGEKRSAVQLSRKYCQGGGKKPDNVCYQICIYCKHTFVDEVPENKKVFEKNRLKEQKHEELKK